MPAFSRLLILFSLVSLTAQPLLAQSRSLLPRTPSQNLSDAVPPAFPGYNRVEGDFLTITGRQTKTYFIAGKSVGFKPDPGGISGILRTYFIVNNKTLNADAVNTDDPLPFYSLLRAETNDAAARHVQVVAQTADAKRYSLADSMLYGYSPALTLDYTATVNGERGEFVFKNRSKLGATYCYIEEQCLGKLTDTANTANCDLRHLPPGSYRFAAIAETPDGYLLPFQSYAFTIAPRLHLELPQTNVAASITVSEDQPNGTLVLRAVRDAACSATLARVFADDTYIGEITPNSPEIALPLRDLPTGKIMVEVVPIGKDKFEYPAETISFDLKNSGWEQRTYKTPSYTQIKTNDKRIAAHEREIMDWMSKAEAAGIEVSPNSQSNERKPSGGFRYTLTYLSTLKATGRAAVYLANARDTVLSMAQLTLTNARLYRQLRMIGYAKSGYQRVISLTGTKTSTGSLADGELAALNTRKR